jgi:hypothetical protein
MKRFFCRKCFFCYFEDSERAFFRNRRKIVEKFGQIVSTFDIIEQILNRHSRSCKDWNAAHYFRIYTYLTVLHCFIGLLIYYNIQKQWRTRYTIDQAHCPNYHAATAVPLLLTNAVNSAAGSVAEWKVVTFQDGLAQAGQRVPASSAVRY